MKSIKVLVMSLVLALTVFSVNAQEKCEGMCKQDNNKELSIHKRNPQSSNNKGHKNNMSLFKDLSPETIAMIRIDLMSKKIELTNSQKSDLKDLFIKSVTNKNKLFKEKENADKKFMKQMKTSKEKEIKDITSILGEEKANKLKQLKKDCKNGCDPKKMENRKHSPRHNNKK